MKTKREKNIFCCLKVNDEIAGYGPDPEQDPLVKGTDPRIQIRIRIRTKMSRIRNMTLVRSGTGRTSQDTITAIQNKRCFADRM